MGKRAVFVKNKYYTDSGMEYVYKRLAEEFRSRGITLELSGNIYASYPQKTLSYDFGVYWDKDVALAERLEYGGLRLFNSARTVELCDDKRKTFEALCGKIELVQTVCAPLVYDVSSGDDGQFLDFVQNAVGYPAVVKENSGSQGRQVYLANNRSELEKLHAELMRKPHLIQRFVRGERVGSDIRVYVVGRRAVAAVERLNTTDFRSNVFMGGEMRIAELTPQLKQIAEIAANALNLEYGSADFICEDGKPVFIEANGSVYMQSAERLGIKLAPAFADYIAEAVYGNCR